MKQWMTLWLLFSAFNCFVVLDNWFLGILMFALFAKIGRESVANHFKPGPNERKLAAFFLPLFCIGVFGVQWHLTHSFFDLIRASCFILGPVLMLAIGKRMQPGFA